MSPVVGARMAHITLRGTDFGDDGQASWCGDYKVQMGPGDPDPWVDLPVIIWADTVIECNLPSWTFEPNQSHNVRVITPTGQSNLRSFYVLPGPAVDRIEDNTGQDGQGPAGGWLTVFSLFDGPQGTFNDARDKRYEDPLGGSCPNYHGSVYVVTITSSSRSFCAQVYKKWNASGNKDSFKVRLWNLWEDSDADYYQDGDEPTVDPNNITPGTYSVQVCLIVYGDSDSSGDYTGNDDTIYQVAKSKSEITYEINQDPIIFKLKPDTAEPKEKIAIKGWNFGDLQGNSVVHIDKKTFDSTSRRVKFWSNGKIRIKVPNYKCEAFGENNSMTKKVWVTVGGVDSKKKTLTINKPALCP
jgi:hypothetical protein